MQMDGLAGSTRLRLIDFSSLQNVCSVDAVLVILSLFFFFHLTAHNQHVDYSGAYNWGCSLCYTSTGPTKKRRENGGGGGGTSKVVFRFDTLDSKASRVGASTTFMGNEFQSLMVLAGEEGGASILGSGGQQSELFVMGASLT